MKEYIDREAFIEWLDVNHLRSAAEPCLSELNVLDMIKMQPAADVAPVVHGRKILSKKHLWEKNEDGEIDEFAMSSEYCNGPVCEICGYSFCVHCDRQHKKNHPETYVDKYNAETCREHYVCSECGRVIGEDDPYCHCGARMDGAADQ